MMLHAKHSSLVTCISVSLIFMINKISLCEFTTFLLIQSSVDDYLDCFHVSMNSIVINNFVQIFVGTCFPFSWMFT